MALTLLGCGDDPVDDPDCARGQQCYDQGLCTVQDGQCLAASDADCNTASEVCQRFGLCTASKGRCVAASDEGCQESAQCEIYGGCTAVDGKCIAISDEQCQQASVCDLYGWCTANLQGECVKIISPDAG
jgi:hypothetical protein